MSAAPALAVLAVGRVDADGVVGTAHARTPLPPGDDPLGDPRGFRRVFGRRDETYRRIDRVSRALVLACEAAGLRDALPEAARADTAIVLETARGCLDTDLRFAADLERGVVNGPLFPYTLPSTCLGEVALRHGLRGPTLALSVLPGREGVALAEARALIAEGTATHALVASVEVLDVRRRGLGTSARAAVALLGPGGGAGEAPDGPVADLAARLLGAGYSG